MFQEFLLGKRHRLSWVSETGYGSGGSMGSGEVIGLDARIEPDWNQNWIDILQAGADNRSIQGAEPGPLDLPFTLTFSPVNWKFLQYCGYSVADAGSNPYTHTHTIANVIQSFKLEWALRASTNVVITVIGCTVLGATISFQKSSGDAAEGFVTVALRCIAKDFTLGSSVTSLSAITRSPFQFRHIALDFDGNEIAEINNGEILIEQGINPEDSRYCNATLDRLLGEPIPLTHRISGRFNVNIKDSTFMTAWNTAAVIANCGIDFIQDSSTNKLESVFANFRMKQGMPPTVLDGVTNVDVPFFAESFASLIATDNIPTY